MMRVVVTPAAFAPEQELAQFACGSGAGAMASFVGYCRASSDGRAVERLTLDHYAGFTESELARIAEALASRHAISDLLVIHRVGDVPAGEAIVLVAALSVHRAAAFAAVQELMDYLKTDAPIWKKETGPAGERWIEPTAEDRARRAAHDAAERSP
jgi:molybdopterin synthase catalytic subunit